MNITKYTANIPVSFEWTTTIDGEEAVETVEIEVARASFGLSVSKDTRKALDEQDGEAIAAMLSTLIAKWNLDANGEVFEPTAENILLLPLEFATMLAEKVLATLSPNPQTANGLDNGLAQTKSSLAESKTAS